MLYNFSKIGIVVPCYNEASRLPTDEFNQFFDDFPQIHFCFVNDGSTDDTGEILKALVKERTNHITIIDSELNKGKAEAVRQGVIYFLTQKSFDTIGYWDADVATPLDEIPRFVSVFDRFPSAQFLCGSRVRMMGCQIERKRIRHYLGRIFATIVGIFLRIPIYDTQCGAKLVKSELSKQIFYKPFISRWLFDVELLARTIIILGYKQANQAIVEVPLLKWIDKKGSKLSPFDFIKVPFLLSEIFFKHRELWKIKANEKF